MKNKNQENKMPWGIRIILFIYAIGVLSLLVNIFQLYAIIGPFILEGFWAVCYYLISAAVLIFLITAIISRKFWVRNVLLLAYGVNILMLYFNLFSTIFYKDKILTFYLEKNPLLAHNFSYINNYNLFNTVGTILGTAICLGFIIYLYYLQKYFNKR